jgi:hypothetical protein
MPRYRIRTTEGEELGETEDTERSWGLGDWFVTPDGEDVKLVNIQFVRASQMPVLVVKRHGELVD